MKHFNIWATCMSHAGVSFQANIVYPALNSEEAIKGAVDYLLKNGTTVTLMPGAPAVPVSVAYAVVQRLDEIDQQRISVVTEMPKGLN